VVTPDRPGWLLGVPRARPYVTWLEGGSPAGRGQLYPGNSIVSVNDTAIADLDAFAQAVAALPAGRPVRVGLVSRDGKKSLVTVEPDPTFFPAEELILGADGWERRRL
jgi:S1-C subfamily serine protease